MTVFDDFARSRCEKLQAPDYLNLVVSITILLGLFISYLPQHHRIISRGTSEGISPYFVLLGTTSSTSGFANILVLPASRADVACCKTVSSFECFAGLLGIGQVGAQWFCFSIICLLFLIFFPRGATEAEYGVVLSDEDAAALPTWRTALTVAAVCMIHGLTVIIISSVLFVIRPEYLGVWANILGIMAAVLAGIQYFPQIWTTYTLGHVGSLSIPMMCIQTPGGFLFAGSLAARLGAEGWSTWGVYLVTATLQGVLLAMGVYFEVQARNNKFKENGTHSVANGHSIHDDIHGPNLETDDEGGAVVENGHGVRNRGERQPLLGSNRSSPRSDSE